MIGIYKCQKNLDYWWISGIGFATAKKFLENNWIVIISSSNIKKLQ